jgi:hypothetical protein
MRGLKSFGERIAARDPDRQTAEIHIRVALMDRFNAIAPPRSSAWPETEGERGTHASSRLSTTMPIFVVSLVMVILVNSVPNVIAGLVPGGGAAASAGSSFGAGALMGAGMVLCVSIRPSLPSNTSECKRNRNW